MPVKLKNNAFSTLASSITASNTGIVVATGEGSKFPTLSTGDYFYLTISSANGTFEVVKVTARAGDAMTIVRAQEGSIANSFAAGSLVELRVTSFSVTDSVIGYGPFVNVKAYGAVGDGTTNDTTAIQAAIAAATINGTVFFPKGTYLVTNTLQMLSGQCFLGEGGSMQGTSTIKKGANGDLINMVGLCRLENLNLDCVGATYTGRGIYVSTGFSQVINNVRVTNNVTYALEYQATSGAGTFVTNFVADMIAASADTTAIKVGENYPTNVPRFFQNIWLSNGKFDLTNTVAFTLDGFFVRGFITGPTYDKCVVNKIANGRVSTPGTPLVLSMGDSSITNVPISGTTQLTSCQGLMLANCQFDTLTIDNSSISPAAGGVAACFITDRQRVYTPTWSQSAGTGPVLNNGTIESLVTYNGFKVEYYFRMVMGSTTTYGDSAGAWTFSLPRISSATGTPSGYSQRFGAAYMKLNSGNFIYLGEVAIGAGELVLSIGYQNQSVRGTWPYTWASGDVLEFSISYLAP
jgi:hypothetical protein